MLKKINGGLKQIVNIIWRRTKKEKKKKGERCNIYKIKKKGAFLISTICWFVRMCLKNNNSEVKKFTTWAWNIMQGFQFAAHIVVFCKEKVVIFAPFIYGGLFVVAGSQNVLLTHCGLSPCVLHWLWLWCKLEVIRVHLFYPHHLLLLFCFSYSYQIPHDRKFLCWKRCHEANVLNTDDLRISSKLGVVF